MLISKLSDFLVRSYNNPNTAKRTVYLEGASGIGKSQIIHQTSDVLAKQYPDEWKGIIDLRLSQCDVTDLRGVPSIVDGRTVWNSPDFFPKEGTRGILFLDEITSAPPAMQAVAYQIALDRLGMPDGWFIVAAGNKQSDRGVTFTMAAPLINRMTKIDVETEINSFLSHYMQRGKRPEIAAFLHERPDFMHKFDGKSAGQQFPTPRAWFAASDHLDLCTNPSERVEILGGDIGIEAASQLEAFLRVWETMPKLDSIYKDPDTVRIPDQLNVKYCVAMGLAATLTKDNFNNGFKYLKRMPKEFQTLSVRMAYQRDKGIAGAGAAFAEWAIANQEAFT